MDLCCPDVITCIGRYCDLLTLNSLMRLNHKYFRLLHPMYGDLFRDKCAGWSFQVQSRISYSSWRRLTKLLTSCTNSGISLPKRITSLESVFDRFEHHFKVTRPYTFQVRTTNSQWVIELIFCPQSCDVILEDIPVEWCEPGIIVDISKSVRRGVPGTPSLCIFLY